MSPATWLQVYLAGINAIQTMVLAALARKAIPAIVEASGKQTSDDVGKL